jgi:two-component system OmpR family sensor kinase
VFTWSLGGHRDERWPRAVTGELVVAVVVVMALLRVTHAIAHGDISRLTDVTSVLALCAVAAGATFVLLCRVYARLCETTRRSVWLSLALSVYTVVAIPAATIGATSRWDAAAVGNIRLFAHAVFVALIFLVAIGPPMPRWSAGAFGLLGLVAIAAVLVWLGETYPASCMAVTTSPIARCTLMVFWVLGPLLILGTGIRDRSDSLYRVGLGLEIVAVAHAVRVDQGDPAAPLDLSFSLLRLLGLVLLLATAAVMTQRRLVEVDDAQSQQQRRLHEARSRLLQFRTRDHELRTGLAGLAGATRYVHDEVELSLLHRAITSELSRLNAMMRKPPAAAVSSGAARPAPYRVNDILRDQVALHRSQGMDVRLDITSELCVTGSPDTLAQVVSNLLANCARHAPGSPVHIDAQDHGGIVRIRITDFGPGIPEAMDGTLFQLGSRGPHSEGQGIGLHVCHRLLHQEAGAIYLAHDRPEQSGCTLVVDLPGASMEHVPLRRTS